jgi:hypothetical protein
MLWPVAALAVLIVGFVIGYASLIEARFQSRRNLKDPTA